MNGSRVSYRLLSHYIHVHVHVYVYRQYSATGHCTTESSVQLHSKDDPVSHHHSSCPANGGCSNLLQNIQNQRFARPHVVYM